MATSANRIESVRNLTGTAASTGDTALDAVIASNISYIVNAAESALMVILGNPKTGIPDSLSYIVVDVACARFNRIASEGAASHNLGGESMTFEADDFLRYMSVISAYKRNQAGGSVGIKFL